MTAPTLHARCIPHVLFGRYVWVASVSYAGHVFYVAGQYGSERDALRAADKERDDIVRRCTPEYLAALDRRSNEPSRGGPVLHWTSGGRE